VLVLAIACVVSAAAWVYLVVAHGGFWLTGQRLPPVGSPAGNAEPGAAAGPGLETWPTVAAVVPARNEAESLPGTLPVLLAQDYPGELRVFVVDDNSDDGTGAVAAELGEKAARDGGAPLIVVKGKPRPDGWAGKVWAMAQGLAAAAGTAAPSSIRSVRSMTRRAAPPRRQAAACSSGGPRLRRPAAWHRSKAR
jgi:cellulose synthase/poly-beta-1,6-N-acetylglucosamine synthase-like glycosyltransferase